MLSFCFIIIANTRLIASALYSPPSLIPNLKCKRASLKVKGIMPSLKASINSISGSLTYIMLCSLFLLFSLRALIKKVKSLGNMSSRRVQDGNQPNLPHRPLYPSNTSPQRSSGGSMTQADMTFGGNFYSAASSYK